MSGPHAPLRITVSSPGKSHAFQLARQLARHGVLEHLVTDDPRGWLAPGVPPTKVRVLAPLDVAMRVGPRFTKGRRMAWMHWRVRAHDHLAPPFLGHPNVVVAWAGSARKTLAYAKKRGWVAVCERGSSHIEHQNRVLTEEFARFGGEFEPIRADGIRNELAEYAIADRIMVPSTFAKRTYVAHGIPESKLLQVPYGADVGQFRPGAQADDVFRVGFLGAVSLQKGVFYLLSAMKKLRLPKSEVLLIGPVLPEMEPLLREFEGLYRAVGAKPHDELPGLLQQCTIFGFPSLQEGLSLALREAHATGLPIVATDASGVEDVIEPGTDGFVVPIRDVDALAENIERLYRDVELRRSMAEAARRRATGWGWDQYGDAVVRTYREVLESA